MDNIDPTLCTHGFYGFADLNNVTWKIKPYDPWYDQAPGDPDCVADPATCHYDSYRRFVALKEKNPDFVPMLSIGEAPSNTINLPKNWLFRQMLSLVH